MTHVLVVGAYGSAGVVVAQTLADAGYDLTLIDDGDPGGGLCILRGCMPSKELLSAGAHKFQVTDDHRLTGQPPDVDLAATVETKDAHINSFAAHRRSTIEELTDRPNVSFIHDTARFIDDRTVRVGDTEISGDYAVVATGSTPNIPDLPGIDSVPYQTSADVLDSTSFGESAIVMGFGFVGIELAAYLATAAGMDVTVIEHDDRPLDAFDPMFGDELLDIYREQFDIEILTNTTEQSVERDGDGVAMTITDDDGERDIHAEALFVFTGRRPALSGLGLETTEIDPSGEWVQSTMQARDDDRTFVIGDANNREPILHVAKEQGAIAAENIQRIEREATPLPYENTTHLVVFAGVGVYPAVRVGHTERSATAAGIDHITVDRDASDDGVFKTKAVPAGCARLSIDTDGTVIGYQGLHYHADVMAKTMQVIIEMGLDCREIPDRAYHPTTPELLDGLLREATAALAD